LKVNDEIAGSGSASRSGSFSQRHVSADPDPDPDYIELSLIHNNVLKEPDVDKHNHLVPDQEEEHVR
jgi:hypothetical protein